MTSRGIAGDVIGVRGRMIAKGPKYGRRFPIHMSSPTTDKNVFAFYCLSSQDVWKL